MDKTIEKFLRYVAIDTQSDEASESTPSTTKQHKLAELLVSELEEIGAEEITYDKEHCYVYATIPASDGYEEKKVLGFISHMDTSPAVSGANVNPRIIENYDGKDILLNQEKNIVMRVSDFPSMEGLKGKSLIVTDGNTLLGADDKAGIAEIMAMAEFFLSNKDIKHGKIRIAFTPDEEVGRGTESFDVKLFGADYAYTVDGGALGELEYENFNAAGVKLTVNGRSVHPGDAKGKMINAVLVAYEFYTLLPVFENPMYTEKYEGFYHLDSISGNVEKAVCDIIIRDHDMDKFKEKKDFFLKCADFINQKYGQGTIVVDMKDSYYNMVDVIKPHMHLIDNAKRAMQDLGIEPIVSPIRGGTDGASLSFMGLPCPNLCTGGANYHGKYEYACVESMITITELLKRIALIYSE